MFPGDAPTSPLPLADRIAIALDQLRIARSSGDVGEELAWQTKLDQLVDLLPRPR
jgi:hypothetical protein